MVSREFTENALVFHCKECKLLGIVTLPREPLTTGLIIVVGGPQYRVGSHRQFTLLARHLAEAGIASMRFDYCGMGDSEGRMAPGVDSIEDDIRAAVDTFLVAAPVVQRVSLWGLCGAASASALYAPTDQRVVGVAMLNPWVRAPQSHARAQIKHYYAGRLKDPDMWRRLLRGEMDLRGSLQSAASTVRQALRGSVRRRSVTSMESLPISTRIAESLLRFPGRTLLILSGQDLTANEFRDTLSSDARLRLAFSNERVERHDLMDADHTFAQADWRNQVAQWTRNWLLGSR
jgi:uncharacterized protein